MQAHGLVRAGSIHVYLGDCAVVHCPARLSVYKFDAVTWERTTIASSESIVKLSNGWQSIPIEDPGVGCDETPSIWMIAFDRQHDLSSSSIIKIPSPEEGYPSIGEIRFVGAAEQTGVAATVSLDSDHVLGVGPLEAVTVLQSTPLQFGMTAGSKILPNLTRSEAEKPMSTLSEL